MSERLISPISHRPGRYIVCLGGGTYEVDAEHGTCTCPSFHFRQNCKHVDAVAEELEAERACAYCHGYGQVFLRVRYADDEPITCVHCSGTGLREAPAERDDAELKRMFA